LLSRRQNYGGFVPKDLGVRDGGAEATDSGGLILFLSPGLIWSPQADWLLHVTAQLPALNRLNGAHAEKSVYAVGMSYDL